MPANGPTSDRDLERICARYQADLVAAEWEIQRLQAKLTSLGSVETEAENLRRELSAARNQLRHAEASLAQQRSECSANGPTR